MKDLIKIELYKITKGRSKNVLIFSFIIMFLFPIISLKGTVGRNNDFYSNLLQFYDINYDLILPISIGVFTLIFVCDEFKNKPIKNLIMSKHSRPSIIIAKYISILIAIILAYIFTISIYTLISYFVSDKTPIYFNYKVSPRKDIIFNLLEYNLIVILYMAAIIAFSLMLGLIFKKQGISILIYILVITFLTIVYSGLDKAEIPILRYTFMAASYIDDYIAVPGQFYTKITNIIPIFSNVFLFLGIGTAVFNRYEY